MVCPVLIAVIFFAVKPAISSRKVPDKAVREYYAKQLDELVLQVIIIEELQEYHEAQSPGRANIRRYEDALSGATSACLRLDAKYQEVKNLPLSRPLQDEISNVRRLCQDLEGVLGYAFRLSVKTQPFVLFSPDSINATSAEKVGELKGILHGTKNVFHELKSDPINDPALPELIAYVETMQKSLGEPSDHIRIQMDELKTQQNNFMAARRYFWRNTVDIIALRSSVLKLRQQFN